MTPLPVVTPHASLTPPVHHGGGGGGGGGPYSPVSVTSMGGAVNGATPTTPAPLDCSYGTRSMSSIGNVNFWVSVVAALFWEALRCVLRTYYLEVVELNSF